MTGRLADITHYGGPRIGQDNSLVQARVRSAWELIKSAVAETMWIIRPIAAVLLGLIAGSIVNMGLITLGSVLVPPPPGVDSVDVESIAASMHLFEPSHFVAPFVAHALGTFIGAAVAALIDYRRGCLVALIVGVCFFAGGVAASFMLPAPAAYIALDLVAAYFPMAVAAYWLVTKLEQRGAGSPVVG